MKHVQLFVGSPVNHQKFKGLIDNETHNQVSHTLFNFFCGLIK